MIRYLLPFLIAVKACAACAVDINPGPPNTNYWETITASQDVQTNATVYLFGLRTNNLSSKFWCTLYASSSNSIQFVIPSTNTYSIPVVGVSDGTNTMWNYQTCELSVPAVPFTYMDVYGQAALGVVQTSTDMTNWEIFANVQETNLTVNINGNRFYRTLSANGQQLKYNPHY